MAPCEGAPGELGQSALTGQQPTDPSRQGDSRILRPGHRREQRVTGGGHCMLGRVSSAPSGRKNANEQEFGAASVGTSAFRAGSPDPAAKAASHRGCPEQRLQAQGT